MSDIASRVKAIIVDKLGVDENEVVTEASFTNDLGADSLDTVELIMEFEKEFDIQIPDDQAENIATVGQAISYIEAAKLAHELGLGINAGHDLSLDNIQFFKQNIPHLLEVSIGHALISESIYLGLENVVNMYLNKLK